MKPIVLALVAAGAFAAAGLAQAQMRAETDTMTVRVDDLNLASARGAAIALRRVDQAARTFCGDPRWHDLGRIQVSGRCRSEMTGRAVAQIAAPLVTALYEKTARPLALAVN
jgi:UrcA family protein